MRAEVAVTRAHTPLPSAQNINLSGTRSPRLDDREEDHQRQWAREEQQMMIQEQDRTMDTISGTLNTLVQQAGLMGREIIEHNECVLIVMCLFFELFSLTY